MRVLSTVCALAFLTGCGGLGVKGGDDVAALKGRVERLELQNRLLSNRLKAVRGVDCPAGLERQDAMGLAVICVKPAALALTDPDEEATTRPVIWKPKPSIWRPPLRFDLGGGSSDLAPLLLAIPGEAEPTGL